MFAKLEGLLTVCLVVAAVAVAISTVKSTFFSDRASQESPVYVPGWDESLPISRSVGGSSAAATKIITFVDFECPGCRVFHEVLEDLLSERQDIAAAYVHYPLPYHRFALPAARAAECAQQAGAFPALASILFRKQDSLGLKSWGSFADEAGIRDTAWIARCATSGDSIVAITNGVTFGRQFAVDATPTVIVNGWRLRGTPSKAELDSVITSVSQGSSRTARFMSVLR